MESQASKEPVDLNTVYTCTIYAHHIMSYIGGFLKRLFSVNAVCITVLCVVAWMAVQARDKGSNGQRVETQVLPL